MSESRKILRASGLLSAMTLLSRFTGLARDIAIAAKLGGTLASDVFLFAFELPNLTRRVIGEGALSSIIVPLYAGRKREAGSAEAWLFVNRAINAVFLLTLVLTIIGMIFSREVFNIFGGFGLLAGGGGPGVSAEEVQAAVNHGASLTRLMFPYMIGLALASILMGVCHALGSFGPPAFGSIALNLAMITAAGLAIRLDVSSTRATVWLAWAVLAGAVIRLILMAPVLARAGWRWRPTLALRDPEVRQMFGMMSVGLVGLSINQVNIAVAGIFAGFLGPGNKSFLVFANRLVQLPMALTATALATAMLPRLTELLHANNREELRRVMDFCKRLEVVLMVPAVFGLMFLGRPILQLLFERGQWTEAHSLGAYGALLFYAPGLIPFGFARLIVPLFHAQKDVKTPVKAAAIGMIVNVTLAAVFTFMTPLAQRGLALASTLAAFANYVALAWWMRRKMNLPAYEPGFGAILTKAAVAAILTVGAGWGLHAAFESVLGPAGGTLMRAAYLLPIVALVAAGYFVLLHAMRVPEAGRAVEMIKARLGGRRKNDG